MALLINFMSVGPCWCVHILLAREVWKLWNDNLQSAGLSGYFYPSECNLGRRHNVVQRGVASLTQAMFTGGTGWDGVVVVGDKHWAGRWSGGSTCLANAGFASSHLAASLFFLIDSLRKSHSSDCTVSVTGSLHRRVLCHWCLKFKQHTSCFSIEWSDICWSRQVQPRPNLLFRNQDGAGTYDRFALISSSEMFFLSLPLFHAGSCIRS